MPDNLTDILNLGMGGLLLWYVVKRLDRIQEVQAALVQMYTILITSLPDVKKRVKDEAEAINQRVQAPRS
jgi:hypothetical protein